MAFGEFLAGRERSPFPHFLQGPTTPAAAKHTTMGQQRLGQAASTPFPSELTGFG